ncbi:MAG: hypothetical protein FWC56_03245, partial [Phycisphaerae bacterium]|nr:hypothetical protein [Phycisphaerae bacterium]
MAGVSERDRLRVAWVLMGISAVLIGVGLVIIWSNDSESDSIIKPSPLQLQHLKSSASSVSQPAESASQPTDVVTHNIVAHNAVAHTNNAAA